MRKIILKLVIIQISTVILDVGIMQGAGDLNILRRVNGEFISEDDLLELDLTNSVLEILFYSVKSRLGKLEQEKFQQMT